MYRIAAAIVLIATLALADEATDLLWVDALAEKAYPLIPSKRQLQLAVQQAKGQLRAAKQSKSPMLGKFEQELAFAEKRLKTPKDLTVADIPDIPREQPRVQHAGTVWNKSFLILQVVSQKAAIVELYFNTQAVAGGQVRTKQNKFPVWLETDTRNWTDDTLVDFDQPIIFTGTRQYESVSGARTLPVARPWTAAELQRFTDWKPKK